MSLSDEILRCAQNDKPLSVILRKISGSIEDRPKDLEVK